MLLKIKTGQIKIVEHCVKKTLSENGIKYVYVSLYIFLIHNVCFYFKVMSLLLVYIASHSINT